MIEPVEVRSATPEDLVPILQIDRETPEAPHWPEAIYANLLAAACPVGQVQTCVVVAAFGVDVAGYAVARVVDDETELETVAVAASFRRRGIGRELCHAVMAWSRMQGASLMNLEVRAQSMGPQALYAEVGFRVTGRRPGYYRLPDDDAVLMQASLEDSEQPKGNSEQPRTA